MAKIKQKTLFQTFTLNLTFDEMDHVIEVATAQQFSILEIIQAAFKIGIIQLLEKTHRDNLKI